MQARTYWLIGSAAFVLALVATLASLAVVRESGEVVSWCDAGCETPRLAAGFPAAYLYDVPGVSVEQRMGPEDEVRTWPFALNVGFYLVVASFLFGAVARLFTARA